MWSEVGARWILKGSLGFTPPYTRGGGVWGGKINKLYGFCFLILIFLNIL